MSALVELASAVKDGLELRVQNPYVQTHAEAMESAKGNAMMHAACVSLDFPVWIALLIGVTALDTVRVTILPLAFAQKAISALPVHLCRVLQTAVDMVTAMRTVVNAHAMLHGLAMLVTRAIAVYAIKNIAPAQMSQPHSAQLASAKLAGEVQHAIRNHARAGSFPLAAIVALAVTMERACAMLVM